MKTTLMILLIGYFGILFIGCSEDSSYPKNQYELDTNTDTQETIDTQTTSTLPINIDTDIQTTADTQIVSTLPIDTDIDTQTTSTLPINIDTDIQTTADTQIVSTLPIDTDIDTQTTSTLPTCEPLNADFDECIDSNHLGQYVLGTISTDPNCLPQPLRIIECKCIKHEPFDYCKNDV